MPWPSVRQWQSTALRRELSELPNAPGLGSPDWANTGLTVAIGTRYRVQWGGWSAV